MMNATATFWSLRDAGAIRDRRLHLDGLPPHLSAAAREHAAEISAYLHCSPWTARDRRKLDHWGRPGPRVLANRRALARFHERVARLMSIGMGATDAQEIAIREAEQYHKLDGLFARIGRAP